MIAVTPTQSAGQSAAAPRVWLLFGDRRGDNMQVRALADMLGWPYEIKQLHWNPEDETPPEEAGLSLAGLDRAKSDALMAPWPDLIVGIGYRSGPVSRWIAAQGGNRAINIRLGRPRTDLRSYDLVITTPQYGLPAAPNVRELPLPLVRIDASEASRVAERWQASLAPLPRPWVCVSIGGATQHMAFDEAVAQTLARDLQYFAARTGASLLVTTSPRSPPGLKAILEAAITAPHLVHEWRAETENPYLAFLSLGDAMIVTSDSASMAADAASFGKPLLIYELPWLGRRKKPGIVAGVKRWVRERRERRGMEGRPADPLDQVYDSLTRVGRARPRRNALGLTQKLYAARIARPFRPDDADLSWRPAALAREGQDRLVAEIKDLWAARRTLG